MERFEDLVGKVITDIQGGKNSEELVFTLSDGSRYRMYHSQDCCECVDIEDIDGDLNDLLNTEVLMAEESTNNDPKEGESPDSCTWTFYRLRTAKGYVVIRWYGTSNGYYSEGVSFEKISDSDF